MGTLTKPLRYDMIYYMGLPTDSEITFQEIIQNAGVSPATFQKYKGLGLLPRPLRREGLRGNGSVTYYPSCVMEQIQHIRRLKREGKSLREIQAEFLHLKEVETREIIPVGDDADVVSSYTMLAPGFYEQLEKENPGYEVYRVETEMVENGGQKYLQPTKIQMRLKCSDASFSPD
jgi:DNA-binding transcriptional MerR regulator